MQRLRRSLASVLVLVAGVPFPANNCHAQSTSNSLPDAPTTNLDSNSPVTIRNTPRHILEDQEAIWTSPARIRDSNVLGPVALVLGTTLLITADHQVMSSSRLQNASLNNKASLASNGLMGGFIAAPAAIFAIGALHHDDHASETGILGGEAVLDSLAVSEVIKGISSRERPTVDSAKGKFFQSGVGFNSSFPSNHTIIAFSSAAVIASEYDGWLTQVTAYGLAGGVGVARIMARQHFPSDVFVAGVIGWMIGRHVVHRHRHAL